MTRSFSVGDILSVLTGRMLSPHGITGVYTLLEHMTGDQVFTHQLVRVMDECRPALAAQHPDLAAVYVPTFAHPGQVAGWLAGIVDRYGETRPVEPLPPADHTHVDPEAEARMHYPHLRVLRSGEPPRTSD